MPSVTAASPTGSSRRFNRSYSLEEAASILRCSLETIGFMVARRRLVSYQLHRFAAPRVTAYDLFEFSILTGRCLNW